MTYMDIRWIIKGVAHLVFNLQQQLSKLKVGSLRMCSMFTRLAPQVYEVTQASTTHSVFPSSVLLYTVGKPKQHWILHIVTSALPLSHDRQTTTNFHNPLYVLYRWYWMPQSHTWQPLSMCRQNSVMDWPSGKNWLSWLSDRAWRLSQRCLGSTPGGCRPFTLSFIFAS